MKLFTVIGSPNGRKVLSVINHLSDLDIEIEYLDMMEDELRSNNYSQLNPNAKVPTLIDDDLTLWESNAINQYLCDKSNNNTLYPTDPKTRADINRWLLWEIAHYNHAFGTLAFEEFVKPNILHTSGNIELASIAKENLKRYTTVLDQHMAGREFIVGDSMTIADYAVTQVEFFKDLIDFDWSDYPHVNAMYDRIRNNKNWMSTVPSDLSQLGRRPAS